MAESKRSGIAGWPEQVITYLRANDQITISLLVGLGALGVAIGFANIAWNKGGLVQIESMPQNVQSFRVDLNEADWTEIAALPTMGEVMAKRVVAFRESNGQIDSLASLAQIHGIGPKTIAKIEPFIAEFPQP